MLAVSSKYGMLPVELFIEHAPSHPHLNNKNDNFIQLFIDGIDVDEENNEDKEDDRYGVIHNNEVVLPNDDENCGKKESFDLIMVQQVMEFESIRYVNLEVGARLNDPNGVVEVEVENTLQVVSPHGIQVNISNDNVEEKSAHVSYHMSFTQQFLNTDGAINCVLSDWTPLENQPLGNIEGHLSIGQIFPSKVDL